VPIARSRILAFLFLVAILGLSNPARAQITTDQGIPAYAIQLPVPLGFVSATTGKLHLEIPLRARPQRNGDPIVEKLVYDSVPWLSGASWIQSYGDSHHGTGSYQSSSQSCTSAGFPGWPFGNVTTYYGFYFQDNHFTSHAIVNNFIYTKQVSCSNNQGVPYGSGSDTTSAFGCAADNSGYCISVSNYTQMRISAADGTLVYDSVNDKQNVEYPVDNNGNFSSYASSTFGLSGSQPDTSRSVSGPSGCGTSYQATSPCTVTYSFVDSSGSARSYNLTWTVGQIAALTNGNQTTYQRLFLTSIALQDGNQYSLNYDTGTVGNHNGALLNVTLPTGGTVAFTYYPVGSPNIEINLVNTVTYGGGTWNFSYAQNSSPNNQTITTLLAPARYDYASKTNVNDKTVFTTVNNGYLYPFLQTAQFYSGSSTLLKTISVTYDTNGNYLPQTVTTTLNDTGQSSTVSYQYFNNMRDYPNQIQETDFSGTVVRTKSIGTPVRPTFVKVYAGTTSGALVSSTLYTYDEYSASYCKNGVPNLTTVTGAYGHDDTYGNFGNLTTTQRLISGTNYSTTHNCYDTLGNVTQTVDANGNPTSFDYTDSWNDSYCIPSGTTTHAYPTTVTDALGYRTKISYFSCAILKQSAKDENDIRASRAGTTFTYDLFNRLLTKTDAAGGSTTNTFSPSVPPSNTSSTAIASGVSLNSTALQDTYGRTYQTQLTSDPDGTTYGQKVFDGLGHVVQIYNPTRCSPPTTNCGELTWGSTTTTYDALGRVTSVTSPDGQVTTTTYSGPCATTTDPAGKARKTCSDAFGRLIQVFEDPAGLNYETDYTYDVLNNLLTVNQKGGSTNSANWRTRTFSYDGLSRLTSATNPESGTVTYVYDANGNLLSKTSPKPNQTSTATVVATYTYDALNRLTQKASTTVRRQP
jgi:YD repeat-containing protein